MPSHSVWFRSGGLGSGATQLVADTQLTNHMRLRYGRGISRGGLCQLDVFEPSPNPAPGDYLEIRYGATPSTDPAVWSGIIREAVQDQEDPGLWHVTGSDPVAWLDELAITKRARRQSSDERTLVTADILTEVGITSTSNPFRYTTNSILDGGAGTTVGDYSIEYDYAGPALKQAAIVFDREIGIKREDIAGTKYWTVYYIATFNSAQAGVSQDTWRAGDDVDHLKDITDSWDKSVKVTVIGGGDGNDAATGAAGAAATSDPQAAVPLRSLRTATMAGNAATTLQSAFGSNRRVFVAELGLPEPTQETPVVDLGYLVTLQDEAGVGLGDYRVIYLEVDEEGVDWWWSRATLIGSGVPVIPGVTGPAGNRPPGLVDVEDIASSHQRYSQVTSTNPQNAPTSSTEPQQLLTSTQQAAATITSAASGSSSSTTTNIDSGVATLNAGTTVSINITSPTVSPNGWFLMAYMAVTIRTDVSIDFDLKIENTTSVTTLVQQNFIWTSNPAGVTVYIQASQSGNRNGDNIKFSIINNAGSSNTTIWVTAGVTNNATHTHTLQAVGTHTHDVTVPAHAHTVTIPAHKHNDL